MAAARKNQGLLKWQHSNIELPSAQLSGDSSHQSDLSPVSTFNQCDANRAPQTPKQGAT